MKKEKTNENAKTIGDVTHTHTTHKYNLEDEKIKKLKIAVYVFALIAFTALAMMITNTVKTRESLDKIIYNAKKEAENLLLASGRVIYTEDIENDVGSGSMFSHNENLPVNTIETQQEIGTVVAPKANWNVETVTAISVGNGDTVPVPKGFYYV